MRIHTFAEGFFSKLAHDLELVCGELTGRIENDTAVIEAPVQHIRVGGVLVKGQVDGSKLSSADQLDILAKMRDDVFHTKEGVVRVEASRASIRLRAPSGATVGIPSPTVESSADRITTRGSFELPMSAIGASVVKGPMGAFRVKDRVLVHFEVVFRL